MIRFLRQWLKRCDRRAETSHKRSPATRLEVERLECRIVPSTLLGLVENGNQLLRFDSATPGTIQATIDITGLTAGDTIEGIDFRPATGALYGLGINGGGTGTQARLYVINPATGAASALPNVSTLTADPLGQWGMSFDPVNDQIRVVNITDENARLNPINGSRIDTVNDTDLTHATKVGTSLDNLAYDRPFSGTTASTLFALDDFNPDTLVRVGGVDGTPSPNSGVATDIGASFDLDGGTGLDFTYDGKLFASTGVGGASNLFEVNPATGAAVGASATIGDGTKLVGGLAAVPESLYVVAADAGGGPHVRAFDSVTGAEKFSFFAYPSFTGGIRVATADVNGDGITDVITGAGPSGGPHVKVFSGATGTEIRSFFAYSQDFRNGIFVAGGDVNGDGFADIITGTDSGGGPHVKVFSGATGDEIRSFFAYNPGFTGGVRVAAGDTNGDGFADIVTGAGPSGGPHIKVFDGSTNAELASFFAFDPAFTNGVYVAAGDLNHDGLADIIIGAGAGGGPHVRAFSGANTEVELISFFADDPAFSGGVRVGFNDTNGDGAGDIVVGLGPGDEPLVKIFDSETAAELESFFAFDPGFPGGVFVN